MFSRITLIFVLLACCNVHKAEAVSWADDTCPLDIPESKSKDNLHTFIATGTTPTYMILTQSVSDRFEISPTGVLSSKTKLDYDSNEKSYTLEIMASNEENPPNANLTCEIRVTNVNDKLPKFVLESYSVNILNDVAKDTILLNVSATDRDVSDGINTVVYSIKEGSDKANFAITSDTGVINAAKNLTGPHTFMITVVATDNANSTLNDEASVSVCIRCTSGSSSLEISMFAFMALVFCVVLM